MISIADVLFLAGVGCTLAGCWLRGVPDFMVGVGLTVCLGAYVLRRIQLARRRGR